MRVEFAQAIIENYSKHPQQVFISGDLGFMALENVKSTFGDFFLNAGVAEQNMVTIAAAMAHKGFTPWVYSISPFVSLRPYEQIRNDACLHQLPVKLVGNGGGFGYGIMGSTHHNLEDIGAMRVLPNMEVIVPFTNNDVGLAVQYMLSSKKVNYLRLNLGATIDGFAKPFSTWRKIKDGKDAVVIGCGPITANILEAEKILNKDFEIWVVSIFPFGNIPAELITSLLECKKLITIEEHHQAGGLNEAIAAALIGKINIDSFLPLYAEGYKSGKYGNQKWHQEENELSGAPLINKIKTIF